MKQSSISKIIFKFAWIKTIFQILIRFKSEMNHSDGKLILKVKFIGNRQVFLPAEMVCSSCHRVDWKIPINLNF